MLDRLDVLVRARLRGVPAILGAVLVATLAVSLLLFFVLGNARASRVLFFPGPGQGRLVAEERLLPRHGSLEANVEETAEAVLLGPARSDAQRLFPRGGRVVSVFLIGRTIVLDLSPQILADDPELPVRGRAALDALERTVRFNFPRLREVDLYVDGQRPRFPGEQ